MPIQEKVAVESAKLNVKKVIDTLSRANLK